MCFFNWIALNAQSTYKTYHAKSYLATFPAEGYEPDLQLQDWMLDFKHGYLAGAEDPEMKVEPWMLSFNLDYLARTDDCDIPFEPWMVNFEQRCLVVDAEPDNPLESWMVSTFTWDCGSDMLARE
jgi:hypothetical protein